jgi:hypothetical protein
MESLDFKRHPSACLDRCARGRRPRRWSRRLAAPNEGRRCPLFRYQFRFPDFRLATPVESFIAWQWRQSPLKRPMNTLVSGFEKCAR